MNIDTEAFRCYSWQTMLAAAGTYDKPAELDRMGRAKDHGQKGVASTLQRSHFNAGDFNPPKSMHPFKNYHFTRHLD